MHVGVRRGACPCARTCIRIVCPCGGMFVCVCRYLSVCLSVCMSVCLFACLRTLCKLGSSRGWKQKKPLGIVTLEFRYSTVSVGSRKGCWGRLGKVGGKKATRPLVGGVRPSGLLWPPPPFFEKADFQRYDAEWLFLFPSPAAISVIVLCVWRILRSLSFLDITRTTDSGHPEMALGLNQIVVTTVLHR